jgi:hypothetical protein
MSIIHAENHASPRRAKKKRRLFIPASRTAPDSFISRRLLKSLCYLLTKHKIHH